MKSPSITGSLLALAGALSAAPRAMAGNDVLHTMSSPDGMWTASIDSRGQLVELLSPTLSAGDNLFESFFYEAISATGMLTQRVENFYGHNPDFDNLGPNSASVRIEDDASFIDVTVTMLNGPSGGAHVEWTWTNTGAGATNVKLFYYVDYDIRPSNNDDGAGFVSGAIEQSESSWPGGATPLWYGDAGTYDGWEIDNFLTLRGLLDGGVQQLSNAGSDHGPDDLAAALSIPTVALAPGESTTFAARFGGPQPNQPCEIAEITPSDAATDDGFGVSIALDGDVAVVGAPRRNNNTGAAYVVERQGDLWVQLATLTASDAASLDEFGHSVAISGDIVVVGAWFNNAAYVFVRPPGGWQDATEDAMLIPSDGSFGDRFGWAVGISGGVAVVGASQDRDGAGSAYVFEEPPGGWQDATEDAKLTARFPNDDDRFGRAVSIDGDVIVIGAPGRPFGPTVPGAVFVFERPGIDWVDMTETAELTASDAFSSDNFGYSVSISGDVVLVGARHDDSSSGSAYVFHMPEGGWVDANETAKLVAADLDANYLFGSSVALDGNRAVIGATLDDDFGMDTGSAYVYRYDGSSWNEEAKLISSDAAADDEFGTSVALSGHVAAIGSHLHDEAALDGGSAYVYDLHGCCPSDLDGSGDTGIADFLALLAAWGTDPGGPPDFDDDGNVGIEDFLLLLASWGSCT